MSGRPRKEVIDESQVGVYHVWDRCVRRAWLCGNDPVSGIDYSHRKAWIYERLGKLAQIFAVDACVFAILSNHYHLLLRNRPDLTAQWSDEEVVRRWWQLCPERRTPEGEPEEPTKLEIQTLLSDQEKVAGWRTQLSSISCLMKCLNEWIAKRANREDDVTGHFFQGRFNCCSLLDEGAILAGSIYIDLNEIRAQLAATPETSCNTSVYFRLLARVRRQLQAGEPVEVVAESDSGRTDPDDWLCPIDERECAVLLGPPQAASVAESKDVLEEAGNLNLGSAEKRWRHGFLPIGLDEYLELLDWTGRRVVVGKKGAMDADLPPILERLQIAPAFWLKLIENFEKWFGRAAGSYESLMRDAQRTGQRWRRGVGPMRGALG